MKIKPLVLTIAGSDPSGCAGMQADLQTYYHFDVQALSVITAITAQNLKTFSNKHILPARDISNQLALLASPSAVKIGMLGSPEIINAVLEYLAFNACFKVLDPLLMSSSGQPLFIGETKAYLLQLKKLFPSVDLLTPNRQEAELLSGVSIHSVHDVPQAASSLLQQGVKAVLLKGGHLAGDYSGDYFTNGVQTFWLTSRRIHQRDCRGTGCVLSSAIAATIAHGYSLNDALVQAKMYVNRGIRLSAAGAPFSYFVHGDIKKSLDLPYLTPTPFMTKPYLFDQQNEYKMGLYPIVDDITWLKRLLPLGIQFIQLRVKNKDFAELNVVIKQAVQIANEYQAKLYINDHWELAIKYGAYGVHLGQEDLQQADIAAIHQAGLRLGISTHCYQEVARAHALHPTYVACGPIFHTDSKRMAFAPQGLAALGYWRQLLDCPLVAIGGITLGNLPDVLKQGVNGVAMISAITQAEHAELAAQALQTRVKQYAA